MVRIISVLITLLICGCSDTSGKDKESEGIDTNIKHTVTIIEDFGYHETISSREVSQGLWAEYYLSNLVAYYPGVVSLVEIGGCGGLTIYGDAYRTPPLTSSCTITANYSVDAEIANIVNYKQSGYINDGIEQYISVAPGLPFVIDIASHETRSVAITGCGGLYDVASGTYSTPIIGESCNIEHESTPKTNDTVHIQVVSNIDGMVTPMSTYIDRGESAEFHVKNGLNIHPIISGCGGSLSPETSFLLEPRVYTTDPLTGDCTISADFQPSEPVNNVLVASVQGGGSVRTQLNLVSSSVGLTIDHPYINYDPESTESISLYPQPYFGHTTESISGCDGAQIDEELLNIYIPSGLNNCEPVINFAETPESNLIIVKVLSDGPGSVVPESLIIQQGTSMLLNINPDPGYIPVVLSCLSGNEAKISKISDTFYLTEPFHSDPVECTIEVQFIEG